MSDPHNLAALIEAACVRHADVPLFRLSGGQTISRAEFLEQVDRIAAVLAAAGIRPGDRVSLQAEKSPEAAAVYVATLKIGAVFNPLNTAYTPAEVSFFLQDCEPSAVIAPAARLPELPKGAWASFSLEADGTGSLTDAVHAGGPFGESVARSADDLAVLAYTSGTTGRSKGAMITHGNLSSNALTLVEAWHLTPGERLIHALPIYHVHGLFVGLNTALLGGLSMDWFAKFEVSPVLDALSTAQIMMGVPTFYTRLLAEQRLDAERCRNVRLFVSGSAPLLAGTHAEFRERTGQAILERYGMTETGMIASNPHDGERRAGTVGYALPGIEIRVTDAEGRELPAGEPGGVEVRGPNVFKGYWRLPEKTATEFRDGGWFITGDQGVLAGDGRLTLVGRAKDLIITGGLNVYPVEIEEALGALPGITEAAVIGVPHPDFGEAVVAVVTLADGAALDEADAIATLGKTLANFKRPKRVIAVPALPRNTMGKVLKAELRAAYRDEFNSERPAASLAM